jgi:beta-phosphoglucomutase
MSEIKGFIFDLDGVLVDTARFHYLAWKRLAREEFNFELTPELNEQFKGVNRIACMKLQCQWTGATLSPEQFTEMTDRKNGWYVEYVQRMTPEDVLPGALGFVKACRAAGLKLAIGSASKNCRLVLSRTGLTPLFDAVSDGTVVTRAKPDPEVFLKAAEMLGLQPARCAVFEDAQAGIEAAVAGGMAAVAICAPGALTGFDAAYPGLHTVSLPELLEKLNGM